VEAYYKQLDDLIVDLGRTDGRVTNDGEGTNVGADMMLTRQFGDGWSANVTYSWNRQRLDDNDGAGTYTADFSRRHFFSAAARWEISERWQIGARWKYGSGRPTDSFVVREDVLGAGQPVRFAKELIDRNGDRAADYHSLNFRVDYRRPMGPVDLILFLDVINAYGGPEAAPREFNPRTGTLVASEDEALPLIGFMVERSW
ncbi:MAG: TonB-dependent receptor, partial [Pseudomonadota bacterium]